MLLLQQLLRAQGGECTLKELGNQTLPDGTELELPPALLGTLGNDPNKKTLLVYGHLDVQPAHKVFLPQFFVVLVINIVVSFSGGCVCYLREVVC